jgi:hypothetical protein
MPIAFSCHECDRRYQAHEDLAGKRIKCKQCGAGLKVPGSRSPAPSPSPATRTVALAAATPQAAAARSSGRPFDAYGLDDEAPAARSDPFDAYDVAEAAPTSTPGGAGRRRRAPEGRPREEGAEEEEAGGIVPRRRRLDAELGQLADRHRPRLVGAPAVRPPVQDHQRLREYQGIAGIVAAVLGLILVLLSSARVSGAIVGLTLGGAALAACGALYLGSQGGGRAASPAKSPRPSAAVVVPEDRADDPAEVRAAPPAETARPAAAVAVRVDRADDPMVGQVSWTPPPPRLAAGEFHHPARPPFPAPGSFPRPPLPTPGSFPRPSFPSRVAAP